MLTVSGISKTFSGFRVLSDVSFEVGRGVTTAIIGPNGAGKSTLFNVLTGHARPESGSVFYEGSEITGLAPHKTCRLGIGRSFQRANVFARMSVFDNIQTSFIAHRRLASNFWSQAQPFHRREVDELLVLIGLPEHAAVPAGQLSYGHQKQLELGLALAGEPRFLLLDEPTAGMSPQETSHMMALLKKIIGDRGLTLLFTEHDMDVVFSTAAQIIVLHHGCVIACGAPDDVRRSEEVQRIYLGSRR